MRNFINHTCIALLLVVFLFLTGCNKLLGSKDVEIKRTDSGEIPFDPTFYLRKDAAERDYPYFPDGPLPLSGRLLVKIGSKEVNYIYKTTTLKKTEILKLFPELHILDQALSVSNTIDLGLTEDGKRLMRVDFKKPVSLKLIRDHLKSTPLSIPKNISYPRDTEKDLSTILIEGSYSVDNDISIVRTVSKYPQLRKDSELIEIFQKLGVTSIRRVFPMTEIPDGKSGISVTPMTTLLDQAKKQFPIRDARRIRTAKAPENMENWFVLLLRPGIDLQDSLSNLRQTSGIQQATYDYPIAFHQDPTQEPDFSTQWALHSSANWGVHVNSDVNSAWNTTPTNAKVVVAVADRGIKEDLDEFSGRIWNNPNDPPGDLTPDPFNDLCGADDDCNGYIDDITGITVNNQAPSLPPMVYGLHGTMVGAVIGANSTNGIRMSGTAGEADIALMNVSFGLFAGCEGTAEGVMYATLNGADIINMSWGTWPNPLLWEAIQASLASGVTNIASAGNNNNRVGQNYNLEYSHYPSTWENVISVGGSDQNGHRWNDSTNPGIGSNYGIGLDLMAPAINVTTVSFSSPTQTTADHDTMSGTSASAALVSGVASLVLANYPTTRVERMRAWLKVTATDLLDPENTGVTLTGFDQYSGGGIVNAKNAVTQGEPDPVIVDIEVEKSWYQLHGGVSNAVGQNPDLGIKVQGPFVGRWKLKIGESDWPCDTCWTDLADAIVNVSESEINVSVQPQLEEDIDGGHRYLDTDQLKNKQIYTIKLEATDASGNTYTDYDWFMPIRAMILYPGENKPVIHRWGVPPIRGLVDVRPGATYSISVEKASSADPDTPSWSIGDSTVYQVFSGSRGFQYITLAVPESSESPIAYRYPNLGPPDRDCYLCHGASNLERQIVLRVQSKQGLITEDTQTIILDPTNFPMRQGWPLKERYFSGLEVVDIDGNGSYRVITESRNLMSLTSSGLAEWDLAGPVVPDSVFFNNRHYPPSTVIDDFDNDNIKEIVYYEEIISGNGPSIDRTIKIHLIKGTNTSTPVTFNSAWPLTMDYFNDYAQTAVRLKPEKLFTGDIDGNGTREIIFKEMAHLTGVPASDVGISKLQAVNPDGTALLGWPIPIAGRIIKVIDLDNDNKDEILVENGRSYTIYEDSGNEKTGWPMQIDSTIKSSATLVQLDADVELELLVSGIDSSTKKVVIYAFNHDGSNFWSTPVLLDDAINRNPGKSPQTTNLYSFSFIKTAQLVPGGSPEIIIASDKIKVINADGSVSTTFPVIDLNGQSFGLKLIDVDYDGIDELIVLVLKWSDNDGFITDGHFALEAYEIFGANIGASLESTDNRWPFWVSASGILGINGGVAIEDIDRDGKLEIIHSLLPYLNERSSGSGAKSGIEVLNID